MRYPATAETARGEEGKIIVYIVVIFLVLFLRNEDIGRIVIARIPRRDEEVSLGIYYFP